MPLDLTVIAYKDEAVPGTYNAPTFAADAIQAFNYQVTPIQGQTVRRSIDLPYAGRRPSVRTAIHAAHAFDVELTGAGTSATTKAWWEKLLKSCLFGAATVGASDVTYPLISSGDGGAGSIWGNKDNVQHRGFSSRGSVSFDFTEKQLPKMSFNFLSLIQGGTPAVAAAPAGTVLPVYPVPVEVNLANTLITLDGYTLGVRSLKIDMGNKPAFFSTTGGRAIIFDKDEAGDRRSASGTLVAELPDPSVKEYFTAVGAGTSLAFALTHGLVAGNIITMASAGFIPTDVTYSVENNRLFMNMPFDLVPTAANNELTLKTK